MVALVAAGTKFISGEPLFEVFGYQVHAGSWIVVVLIPILIVNFLAIHRHYQRAAEQVATETPLSPEAIYHTVVVPVSEMNRVTIQTLAYACSISSGITAVHLAEYDHEIDSSRHMEGRHGESCPPVPSACQAGACRDTLSIADPRTHGVYRRSRGRASGNTLTVVLPEFVPAHWREQPLHTQTALRLKAALLFRPGTVVVSVPYRLR